MAAGALSLNKQVGVCLPVCPHPLKCSCFSFSFCVLMMGLFVGLQRCGKSCRLRWTNYLRPDLKRGAFTGQEEELIVELHSVLGNRWPVVSFLNQNFFLSFFLTYTNLFWVYCRQFISQVVSDCFSLTGKNRQRN